MLKITVGLCSEEEIFYFIENGADEISIGIEALPSYCHNKSIAGLKLPDIVRIAKQVHAAGKKIFVYANEILPDFNKYIPTIEDLHETAMVDGFIVASTNYLQLYSVTKSKPIWVLGILGFCSNSFAAQRYRKQGIDRIIIPQMIQPFEAKDIIKYFNESEFYYLGRERCINIDGLCLGCNQNIFKGRFCLKKFSNGNDRVSFPMPGKSVFLGNFYECSKMNVFVKIVRFGTSELRKLVFREVKALRDLADKSSTKENFIENAVCLLKEEFDPLYDFFRKKRNVL